MKTSQMMLLGLGILLLLSIVSGGKLKIVGIGSLMIFLFPIAIVICATVLALNGM